ncbi:MAG: N-acetylneuraminate synthase [Arcobacteraceae bacterium]|jgi:N,N'-diacetyllegionaminate synthase|nr:N-acetylneuraminate synthase [Arcobacteraceae bacterium]MDY0327524.1 N-acetylneuraminate synthase [Arcobacteraceae bacterium]
MSKVFIIAEAGVNHNGSLELAKKLVDVAVEAKADAVKFQTFKAVLGVSKFAPKAQYQKETTDVKESQLDMVRKLELTEEMHEELIKYCKEKNIIFLSTPFDLYAVDLLDSYGLDTFKIPSSELTNLPYLRKISKMNKKIILSTGMANLGEIESAIDILVHGGTPKDNITLLHVNSEYPTPMADVNLKAMNTIGNAFGMKFGYSDHTLGIEVPIAAVALGACVIEKHFTLDCGMHGPDHRASLNPQGLKDMVSAIRNIELALGDGIKKASQSEAKNKAIARKSVVAKTAIKAGEIFTEENITVKRPGTGICAMKWDEVIGQKASKDYLEDELI